VVAIRQTSRVVDHELEIVGLLDRQLAGFGALTISPNEMSEPTPAGLVASGHLEPVLLIEPFLDDAHLFGRILPRQCEREVRRAVEPRVEFVFARQ
jgi:hypothetical protein